MGDRDDRHQSHPIGMLQARPAPPRPTSKRAAPDPQKVGLAPPCSVKIDKTCKVERSKVDFNSRKKNHFSNKYLLHSLNFN